MRLWQDRGFVWAAPLGLVALALNALVPVHLAFDLADALARNSRVPAEHRGVEWRLLALLTGHHDAPAKPDDQGRDHRTACPVCTSLGALAGFAPVAPVAIPAHPPAAMPQALPALASAPADAPAAYRSRAPPAA
jgi:hypothetical protein